MDKGSLVYVNYTLRVKGEDKPIETTIEEVARQAGIYSPDVRYRPALVALGDRWVVPGLDDALLQMSEGEKRTVEVPPEKGYGQRDPSKIKLIPLRKFGEDASRIRVGDQVSVDGQTGVVSYVGSGRVAVDFNHRLAGKTLVYDVEVVKVLRGVDERVRALVSYVLGVEEQELKVTVDGDSATVVLPQGKGEDARYLRQIAVSYIFKYVPELNRVVFQEVYERPEGRAQPAQEQAKGEQQPQATPSSSTSEQA